jgi:hypothetical protein
MNIFFLSFDPKECAAMHIDKHVVKMILESVQLLCSVHHICNEEKEKKGHKITYIPSYKLTHKNHPCAIWARKSLSNYIWLINLTKELCLEYTFRYKKVHKCESSGIIKDLEDNKPDIEDIGFTLPAQAMPDIYKENNPKNIEDVIYSYKQYYFFEKNYIFNWKNRNVPEWVIEFENLFE